jgi:hypothetical protein
MAGALLFFIGMLTGLWAGVALTGKVKVGIPHLALAAHLNALLGGLAPAGVRGCDSRLVQLARYADRFFSGSQGTRVHG